MNRLKLIKKIIECNKAYDSESIAKAVDEALEESEKISKKINSVRKVRNELYVEYEKKKKETDLEIENIQKECKHPSMTYNPDPSGNSDSFYSCDVCGMEV